MELYNFDQLIDRSQTDSLKIEALQHRWGRTDLIPMWVADMDFAVAPCITNALKKRCDHPIFGYTGRPDSYYKAIVDWVQKRHQWKVTQTDVLFIPGIVPALGYAIHCFSAVGDKVLIQQPVYHPFKMIIEGSHRQVVNNPLLLVDGTYQLNVDHFKEVIKECKLFILCNPHNPGGKVWTNEELTTMLQLCEEHNVLVLSDEIHADLTFSPAVHTPLSKLTTNKGAVITFMSASKAFNIPGLSSAYCIIEEPTLQHKYRHHIESLELANGHLFAYKPVEAAYQNGEPWLEQVKAYIQDNIDYVNQYLQKHAPKIKVIIPQATYLIFLDCRQLELSQPQLVDFFVDKAHLALNDGEMFGPEGVGFMRINVASPRQTVEQAMKNIKQAYTQWIN